jgi:arginine/lysine/ornithine decarboxylase
MRENINDALDDYIQGDKYPWHMPGHKRKNVFGDDMWGALYSRDFTEAKDLDDMHEPEGFIEDALGELAKVYGTYKTYMLVNGSTSGVMTAIHACCDRGDSVLVARNCHKSVYNAICMLDLNPEYIVPDFFKWRTNTHTDREREYATEVMADVTHGDVIRILDEMEKEGRKPKAMILTSPTYEGVISDIKSIADELHRRGILLIVDEAQGAHFRFMPGYSTAMEAGADVVVESLHKTLPAMTQVSLLHLVNPELQERVERYLKIFQTSSPSYIMMQNIEKAVAYCSGHPEKFLGYVEKLGKFRNACTSLKNMGLLTPHISVKCGENICSPVYGYDVGRIVFYVRSNLAIDLDKIKPGIYPEKTERIQRFTGKLFADLLADEYNLVVEMALANYIICISSVVDSEEDYDKLLEAVTDIDSKLELLGNERNSSDELEYSEGNTPGSGKNKLDYSIDVEIRPGIAWNMDYTWVGLEAAAGEVAADFVYAYPPGIPVLVPGERVNARLCDKIKRMLENEINVSGIKDGEMKIIRRKDTP